jgi:16S rRNA (guanine966-N2)-methyltransferase
MASRADHESRFTRPPAAFCQLCWWAMRIIAGTYRSRTLEAPPGLSTRPTSDRLRETLFNVLAPRIRGAAFLDLYAGSGAVGLEALSRGAAKVTFVERAPAALKALRRNLQKLGIESGFTVRAESVAAFLHSTAKSSPKPGPHEVAKPEKNEVVFLDPPYDAAQEYAATLESLGGAQAVLAPGALVVAEHRRKHALQERYGDLRRTRLLEQGDASLSFYEAATTAPDA